MKDLKNCKLLPLTFEEFATLNGWSEREQSDSLAPTCKLFYERAAALINQNRLLTAKQNAAKNRPFVVLCCRARRFVLNRKCAKLLRELFRLENREGVHLGFIVDLFIAN